MLGSADGDHRPRCSDDDWASLTAAERNVAALVAEGKTNRGIAEQLIVAPATVKNHVSNILRRLGIERRADLAEEVWRRRREAPGPERGPDGLSGGLIERRAGNLPAGVNTFLERQPVLQELAGCLEDARLVTLRGPPGIGKSRMAVELAHRIAPDYPDGAWLVELAPVRDESLVPATLATAVSVMEVPGESLTDSLVARVGGRRALLVLDNCEHLVSACAAVVSALLRGCPGLRVMATSREPLTIAAERVWEVPQLSVPPPDQEPVPELLLGHEAVQLFCERARAVHPAFSLDSDAAPAVAEISRRLDGIPLAIELAAARVPVLAPAEIAERLDDRFSLLVTGTRDRVARHSTLEAAFDWSHELLSLSERAVLRRVSVFLGDFSLDAAEAVCAGGDVDSADVLDLLSRLVRKSLVVADTSGAVARYHLLETIRAYAQDRLADADEAIATGAAHARFYVALAEQAEPQLTGPNQEHWFDRLEGERGNLGCAVTWSLEHGETESALRLTGALAVFWRVRGQFSEGRKLAAAALAASDGERAGSRAKALWTAGFMAHMMEDREAARPWLEQSLALFTEIGDGRGRARALLMLGDSHLQNADPSWPSVIDESAVAARQAEDWWCLSLALFVSGYALAKSSDLPAARPLLEESLAVAREAHEKHSLEAALIGLGRVTLHQGDFSAAERILKEALLISREIGEDYGRMVVLSYVGELALSQGQYREARGALDESVAIARDMPRGGLFHPVVVLARVEHAEGHHDRAARLLEEARAVAGSKTQVAGVLHGMALLAVEEGDLDRARRVYHDALQAARKRNQNPLEAAAALHGLGDLARDANDLETAAELYDEALSLRRRVGAQAGVVASVEAIGGLAADAGRGDHAALLLGSAQAQRMSRGYARAPWQEARYEADLNVLRRALTPEELEAALAQGAELSVEEAAAEASRSQL